MPRQLQAKAQAVSQLHDKNENKRYLDSHIPEEIEPISLFNSYNKKTENVKKQVEPVSPSDFLSGKCQVNSDYHKEASERFKLEITNVVSTDIVQNKNINHFKNKVRQEDEQL